MVVCKRRDKNIIMFIISNNEHRLSVIASCRPSGFGRTTDGYTGDINGRPVSSPLLHFGIIIICRKNDR